MTDNERRINLVNQLIDAGLTEAEEAELHRLQIEEGRRRAESPKLSEAYHEYNALTIRLFLLERAGMLDSPEADAIRDESDGPWLRMSAYEKERAGEFSEGLNRRIEAARKFAEGLE